jgi:hypothetical protein
MASVTTNRMVEDLIDIRGSQKFLLWNPKVCVCFSRNPVTETHAVLFMSLHTFTSCFAKMHFNITDVQGSQLISFLEVFRPTFVWTSLVFVCDTFSAHFFRYLISLLGECIVLLRRPICIQFLFCLPWTRMFLSTLVYKCPQSL